VVSKIRVVFSASRVDVWHYPKNVSKNALLKTIINRTRLNCSAKKCILNGRKRYHSHRNKYVAGITWTLLTFNEKKTEIAAFLRMGCNSFLLVVTGIQLRSLPRRGLYKHIS